MKETISKKLDKRWSKLVLDGTKPPVKSCLRKQLHHLVENEPTHATTNTTTTTTNSNKPLLIVFFFEEGDIPIQKNSRSRRRKASENKSFNLDEFYDQKSSDEILNNQLLNDQKLNDQEFVCEELNEGIKTMILTNDSPPLTVNRSIGDDKSPSKNNSPALEANQSMAHHKSPLKNDFTMTNVLAPLDNLITNNTSMDGLNYDDPTDHYLTKLRKENDLLMKQFDDRIDQFQTKIKKTIVQLKQMNYDLKQLVIEKENKQNEFVFLLNEHKRFAITKKLNQNRRKPVKRIKNAIGDGKH
ncbi:unnamed protein product [Adineta ricciae]|uniref:Uncharacterized protein n=1 Tax=Adineta ricciae TaxID=249248 RepID=A0A814S207_ADIRI|nr:unnamed protein product [Adineta ricciae]